MWLSKPGEKDSTATLGQNALLFVLQQVCVNALCCWLSAFKLQCLSALTCISTQEQMKYSAVRVSLRCPPTALIWYSSVNNISNDECSANPHIRTGNLHRQEQTKDIRHRIGWTEIKWKRHLGTTNQIPFTSFNIHFFWAGWKESDRETDICMAGNYHQLVYCMKWGRQLLWRHKEWLQCRRLSSPRRKDEYPVISSSFWREIVTTVRLSTPCIITNDTHKAA